MAGTGDVQVVHVAQHRSTATTNQRHTVKQDIFGPVMPTVSEKRLSLRSILEPLQATKVHFGFIQLR